MTKPATPASRLEQASSSRPIHGSRRALVRLLLMSHLPRPADNPVDVPERRHGRRGARLIGPFLIQGRYQTEDGRCWWTKRHVGKHDVGYKGYNEGKGIWGLWEITSYKGVSYLARGHGRSDPAEARGIAR
ncbi:MAG: hypothetical protein U0790_17195 [Isosphaeraceae bacterium]